MVDLLLDPLRATAFTLGGTPTSYIEIVGFVTGALCVWLVARQHIANWPIGLANSAAFLLLFADAGLYADSALQVVYLALGAYGWWAWVHGTDELRIKATRPVTRTTNQQWLVLAAAAAMSTAAITVVLDRHTASTVPFWDALTTVLSLCATWGQTRKKVESWWLWIAADVIYVPLYAYKDLWLTAVL